MIVLHLCLVAASQLHTPTDVWEIGLFSHFVLAALYPSTLSWHILVPLTLAAAVCLFELGKQSYLPLVLVLSSGGYAVYEHASSEVAVGTAVCLVTDLVTFAVQGIYSRWQTPKTSPRLAKS